MFNKNKKTQTVKGLSYWFLILSGLILATATAWTAYVGQGALEFSKDQSLASMEKPLLKEYLSSLGIETSTLAAPAAAPAPAPASNVELPQSIPVGNPIAAAKEKKKQEDKVVPNQPTKAKLDESTRPVEQAEEPLPPSLQKIFENLRAFENRRAELGFKKIDPVVAKVQKGSLAEGWGFKKGDQINMVATAPVNTLWDLYLLLEETPGQQLSFTVTRGKKPVKIVAGNLTEKVLANQVGLLFVIPKGLNYMSKFESLDLASQFDDRFVKVIDAEFKKDYVDNLNTFSSGLVALPFAQETDLARYEKLNTAAMLVWHHEKFIIAINKFHAQMRDKIAQQSVVMARFQQAIFGFAAAFILWMVAFMIRSRVLSRQLAEI